DMQDDERREAKKAVKDAADKAKEAIDNATTDADVTSAKDNGLAKVGEPHKATVKQRAKDDIDAKAKAKKDAIDGDNQLTNEEKKAAKDKVDAEAGKAKQAVDAATTNDGVTKAQNDAATNINNVDTTPHSKPNAKAEIDAKVEEANKAIDQNKDMTDDERREAKKAVKDAADKAKEAIDNATTDADVTSAKDNGLAKVGEPHKATVKQRAKDDIDAKAKAKKDAIDGDNQL
ncbi:DUF1542 domain-containing protein, partial [Streptococcus sp. 4886]|uniref:DUF1542 domain-containing protein n=1 Tax=Streptococcus sp. 4886 TaxID=2582682 RepID=UPI001566F0E6